jgi:hypothetical protein
MSPLALSQDVVDVFKFRDKARARTTRTDASHRVTVWQT